MCWARDARVGSCLDELKALDLVYEQAYFPEIECMFKHALTHEVALSTLLAERRREMHRTVAAAIETVYADRLHDHTEALALHYFAGEQWEQALVYARQAAERSRMLHAPRAAIEHLSRAIDALERMGAPADPELLRERALAYEAIGRFDDARADHETIIRIARAREELRPEWQANVDLGMLWAARDYHRAGEYWNHASELAEMDGDPVMIARSLNRIGNWHLNVEEPVQSLALHERALAVFEELQDDGGIAETLDFLTMTRGMSGDSPGAQKAADRAIELFRAAGNKPALAGLLAVSSSAATNVESRTVVMDTSGLDEATARAAESLALCREIGWRAGESFALMITAAVRASRGAFGAAEQSMLEALSVAEEIGHRQWETGSHCMVGLIYNELLQPERSRPHLEARADAGPRDRLDLLATRLRRRVDVGVAAAWRCRTRRPHGGGGADGRHAGSDDGPAGYLAVVW